MAKGEGKATAGKANPAQSSQAKPASAPAAAAKEQAPAGQQKGAPVVPVDAPYRIPASTADQIAQVDALLSGKPLEQEDDQGQAGDVDSPDGDTDGGAGAGQPRADESELDDDQGDGEQEGDGDQEQDQDDDAEARKSLYARKVKLADGEEITIGELKDHYQQRAAKVLELQERENKMAEDGIQMDRALRYFESIPGAPKYRAFEEYDEHIRRETAALLGVMPAWREESGRQAAHAQILDVAKDYGIGMWRKIKAELDNPTDHMIIKMLADFAELRGQVAKARERLRPAVPGQQPGQKHVAPATPASRVNALAAQARKTGRLTDQTAAVDALLNGKGG